MREENMNNEDTGYCGVERRKTPVLSESEIDHIAERAAEKAVQRMTSQAYQMVGKSVLGKITWLLGVIVVGIAFYLSSKGIIKIP